MVLKTGDLVPEFSFADQNGQTRGSEEFRGKPLVLVFLRYAGCPICQMDTASLGRKAGGFAAKGAALVVVTQSAAENLTILAGLAPEAVFVADPRGELYKLFGVRVGNLLQYAAPSVLARAREAGAAGYGHGPREGQERQLPAAFVVGPGGEVLKAHYGRNIADSANPEELLEALP